MNRNKAISFLLLTALLSTGCHFQEPISIDYGHSEKYSREDLDDAIRAIRVEFSSFEGCELRAIRYSSDEECNAETLAWMKELGDGTDYVDAVKFFSDFYASNHAEATLNPDTEYTDYQWYLAREKGGPWIVMTGGYG